MTTSVSNYSTTQYTRGPLDGNIYASVVTQQQRSSSETAQRDSIFGRTSSVAAAAGGGVSEAFGNGETGNRSATTVYVQSTSKKTTEELEAQHNELDAVLRDLLSQELKPVTSTSRKQGEVLSAETVDTETVTTHRTSEVMPSAYQQQAVTVTRTAERPTLNARIEYSDVMSQSSADRVSSALTSGRTRRLSTGDDSTSQYKTTTSKDTSVDGATDDGRYRNYVSDSEDQLAWLQEQRSRLQQSVRKSSTWREKSVQEKQLVTELRSAQNALATLRGRTQSESDDLDRQSSIRRTPVDSRYLTEYNGSADENNGRFSRRTSESSYRRDVQQGHYISGLERPPFTTQQTVYTFSVSPHRTTSLDNGLSTSNYSTMNRSISPNVPERTSSSHDAYLKSRQTVREQTVERKLIKNQSVDELDRSLNTLLLQATEIETKPVEIIEEEVISLVPIGPGVQNIEPASASPRMASVSDGLYLTTGRMTSSVSVPASLSMSNGISPPPSSATIAGMGSQSTLAYSQRNQSQPLGYTTLSGSSQPMNNLQTLHQTSTIVVDQQQQPVLQHLIAQQEFQRQQLLQQQQAELQQELQRQDEIRRQQELQRQEELLRQQELIRQEEMRRQQEFLRQEELRKQQELQIQQQLEFERQMQQQQLFQRQQQQQQQQQLLLQQQQQPVLIREEHIVRQRGVSSSMSPLPNQTSFNGNGRTLSSSVSYQTNRRLIDSGHSLSVDGGILQSSISGVTQASPSVVFNGTLRTASVSSVDGGDFSSPTPRFVHDTSKIWHLPNITREEAINLLKDRPAGSFVIRNSSTFQGAFGLAVKVSQLPANVQSKGGDPKSELVRHFLIETTSKGVRLKGCNNEPTFGSLAALVYQHSITPLALPCKLLLPEITDMTDSDFFSSSTSPQLMTQEIACNVIYVNSTDVESLTGPVAISKAIERTFAPGRNPPKTTVVNVKVSSHGITLTDSQRKLFFRRHYPLSSVTYCGVDRLDQRMTFSLSETETATGRMFGFVARKQNSTTENACHLFAEIDSSQSASAFVSAVERILSDNGQLLM